MTRARLWRAFARVTLAVCALLLSGIAYAHSPIKGISGFYAGMLHPLTGLEHVLPFLALGLLIGQQGDRAAGAVVAFALFLMVGAMIALWIPVVPYVALVNILSAVLLGGLV